VAVAKAVEPASSAGKLKDWISPPWAGVHHYGGRLDDWLKILMEKQQLSVDPGYLEWAGVAVFKKATNCSRARLSAAAAFRGIPQSHHWSEFIGAMW